MSDPQSENIPPTPPPPAPEPEAADALAAARAEAEAARGRHLRAVADLENFRKRTLREKDELRQFAAAAVVEDLIPILDNLALGLAAARVPGGEAGAVADGVTMVLEQFKSALGRHGLREINPAGAAFDPHLHECIAHQPDPSVPEEKVISVVRAGYMLNGRLLRPASVVVSSGPAPAEVRA